MLIPGIVLALKLMESMVRPIPVQSVTKRLRLNDGKEKDSIGRR